MYIIYIYERLYIYNINVHVNIISYIYISSFLSYEKLDLFYESMYHTYSGKRRVFPAEISSFAGKIYHTIIYKNYYSVVLYIFFFAY